MEPYSSRVSTAAREKRRFDYVYVFFFLEMRIGIIILLLQYCNSQRITYMTVVARGRQRAIRSRRPCFSVLSYTGLLKACRSASV